MVVEDNKDLLDANISLLQQAGYKASGVPCLKEANTLLQSTAFDLILLDILLPDGNGIDFLTQLRKLSYAPVIVLTALGEKLDMVQGLSRGADDYLAKPFNNDELLARIQAQLRRVEYAKVSINQASFGPINLNFAMQRAFIYHTDLLLKPKEFLMLALLVRANGKTVSPKQIYTEIWGDSPISDMHTVFVHVSNLRAKLRQCISEEKLWIERQSANGFKLMCEMQEVLV